VGSVIQLFGFLPVIVWQVIVRFVNTVVRFPTGNRLANYCGFCNTVVRFPTGNRVASNSALVSSFVCD
jgi:hypothetical protein